MYVISYDASLDQFKVLEFQQGQSVPKHVDLMSYAETKDRLIKHMAVSGPNVVSEETKAKFGL